MIHILGILLLVYSPFIHTAWKDIQSRIAPLAQVKDIALLIPALLHEKTGDIEGLDASLVTEIRSAFNNKQYDVVESLLKDIDHPQALLALGLFNFGSEKGTDYLQTAAIKYQSFEALINLGVQAYAKQDIPQAISYFEEARQQDHCGLSYFYLAMTLQKEIPVTEQGKSREYLEIAANKYHVPEALMVLGYITQPEDLAEDSVSWRTLFENEDFYKNYIPYGSLLYNIGIIHMQKRKKELAYAYLHKAADSYRNNEAYHALGVIYLSQKNYLQACSYLERYQPLNDIEMEKHAIALTIAYLGIEQFKKAQLCAEYVAERCIKV